MIRERSQAGKGRKQAWIDPRKDSRAREGRKRGLRERDEGCNPHVQDRRGVASKGRDVCIQLCVVVVETGGCLINHALSEACFGVSQLCFGSRPRPRSYETGS
jgi:hypothetical protein